MNRRLVVAARAALLVLAGCTSSPPSSHARSSNTAGAAEVTVHGLPSGQHADVHDTGTEAAPADGLDFLSDVYNVGPSGPLDPPAHITIPLSSPAPAGIAIVAATREGASQPWEYLEATLGADRTTATFDTSHFSLFGILGFDPQKFAQQFEQDFLDELSSGLTGTVAKPSCDRQQDARGDGYKITSSTTDTVYWCFGIDGIGRRVLEVTNNAGYPLEVLHPHMQTVANPHDYLKLASLSRWGSGGFAIIAPGVTAVFDADLGAGGSEGISTEMDGFGQSLYALQTGVESAIKVLSRLGIKGLDNPDKVFEILNKMLDVADCADAFGKGPGSIVAACFAAPVMRAAFGAGVALLVTLFSAVSSVAAFLVSEWDALLDQFTSHDKYTVSITRAGAAGVTAAQLASAPVPALCEHPAGRLVDGNLPGLGPTDGYVTLQTPPNPVLADLTGDGQGDAAAVVGCSAGGVSWPDTVVFWGPGPTLLGSMDMSSVYPDEHASVSGLDLTGGDVLVTWSTYTGADSNMRGWIGTLHWDGTQLQLLNVTDTG